MVALLGCDWVLVTFLAAMLLIFLAVGAAMFYLVIDQRRK